MTTPMYLNRSRWLSRWLHVLRSLLVSRCLPSYSGTITTTMGTTTMGTTTDSLSDELGEECNN